MTKRTQAEGASSKRRVAKTPAAKSRQAQAGAANLAKGRANRAKGRAEAAKKNLPTAREKWAMLLDGTITVADLDLDELKAMRVRGKDGVINNGRRFIPSHIAHAMRNEFITRAMTKMEESLPDMTDALVEIATDPDAKDADRLKAIIVAYDRIMGRTAQEVVVSGTGFDEVVGRVVQGVAIDRGLDDETD